MTFSVFFAFLQILLRAENSRKEKLNQTNLTNMHKETIRKDSEPIPLFVKRYQYQSFSLWEKSFPTNKK